MENIKAALEHIIVQLCKTASIYTTIIVIFSYHILLNRDLECTCDGQRSVCWTYMLLPAVLIAILVLWTDSGFQRVLKFTRCSQKPLPFVSLFCIVKASLVGLLWVASVLIDGDWQVCCRNRDPEHPQLACEPGNQTLKATLKNESRVAGLGLLTAVVFVAAAVHTLRYWKCSGCAIDATDLILENGEVLLTKTFKEAAEKKLREKLEACVAGGQWSQCSHVVEEVILEVSSQPVTGDLGDGGAGRDNKPEIGARGHQDSSCPGVEAQADPCPPSTSEHFRLRTVASIQTGPQGPPGPPGPLGDVNRSDEAQAEPDPPSTSKTCPQEEEEPGKSQSGDGGGVPPDELEVDTGGAAGPLLLQGHINADEGEPSPNSPLL